MSRLIAMRTPATLAVLLVALIGACGGPDSTVPPLPEDPPPPALPQKVGLTVFGRIRTVAGNRPAHATVQVQARRPDCVTAIPDIEGNGATSDAKRGSLYEARLTTDAPGPFPACLLISVSYTLSGVPDNLLWETTLQAEFTREGAVPTVEGVHQDLHVPES